MELRKIDDQGNKMKKPQESSIKEAWVLCLVLGLVMINFPFIHIFNSTAPVWGVPKLVFYFFVGWPVSIVVIWVFVSISKKQQQDFDTAKGENDS